MKGLLRKDFYQYLKYCKIYPFVTIPFILYGIIVWQQNSFMLFYPAMLLGLMPMTLMAYEEKEKWDVFSRLLPYKISWMVSVKYMVIFIMNVLLTLIVLGGILFSTYIGDVYGHALTESSQSVHSLWEIAAMMILVGLLMPAFLYPFCFRNGVEKARLVRMIYIVIYLLISGISSRMLQYTKGSPLPMLNEPLGIAAAVVISVILFLLSWRLSIKWYAKREF